MFAIIFHLARTQVRHFGIVEIVRASNACFTQRNKFWENVQVTLAFLIPIDSLDRS